MTTIKIPDIGGEHAEVVEILVKVGDRVAVDDSLITLEGDKSTMDVPTPQAGTIEKILIKVGDKIQEGDDILVLSEESSQKAIEKKEIEQKSVASVQEQDLLIPDLGDANGAEVIEVLVKVGDELKVEDSLITLEGDKATMDVPTLYAGKILSLTVAVGDKV